MTETKQTKAASAETSQTSNCDCSCDNWEAMFNMMQNMDIDKESDTGYERTQKFGDQNVYVKYQKSGNYEKSKLQCTLNGRFGIEANARGMTPEKLWEYIEKLEIEKLIN